MFDKILKFFNENHMAAIAAVILIVGAIYFYGCESKVTSIENPTKKVTRSELQVESDHLIAQVKVKLQDLDKQDAIRQLISDQAALFATTGTFNPMGLANLAVSIFAVGSALDSRRKLNAVTATQTTTTPPA